MRHVHASHSPRGICLVVLQEDVAREMEREYLQEKLQVLADELEFRDRELAALRVRRPTRDEALISAGSWGFPQDRTPDRLPSDLPPRDPEQDLELQVLSCSWASVGPALGGGRKEGKFYTPLAANEAVWVDMVVQRRSLPPLGSHLWGEVLLQNCCCCNASDLGLLHLLEPSVLGCLIPSCQGGQSRLLECTVLPATIGGCSGRRNSSSHMAEAQTVHMVTLLKLQVDAVPARATAAEDVHLKAGDGFTSSA